MTQVAESQKLPANLICHLRCHWVAWDLGLDCFGSVALNGDPGHFRGTNRFTSFWLPPPLPPEEEKSENQKGKYKEEFQNRMTSRTLQHETFVYTNTGEFSVFLPLIFFGFVIVTVIEYLRAQS